LPRLTKFLIRLAICLALPAFFALKATPSAPGPSLAQYLAPFNPPGQINLVYQSPTWALAKQKTAPYPLTNTGALDNNIPARLAPAFNAPPSSLVPAPILLTRPKKPSRQASQLAAQLAKLDRRLVAAFETLIGNSPPTPDQKRLPGPSRPLGGSLETRPGIGPNPQDNFPANFPASFQDGHGASPLAAPLAKLDQRLVAALETLVGNFAPTPGQKRLPGPSRPLVGPIKTRPEIGFFRAGVSVRFIPIIPLPARRMSGRMSGPMARPMSGPGFNVFAQRPKYFGPPFRVRLPGLRPDPWLVSRRGGKNRPRLRLIGSLGLRKPGPKILPFRLGSFVQTQTLKGLIAKLPRGPPGFKEKPILAKGLGQKKT
jgi:hypothetical protein